MNAPISSFAPGLLAASHAAKVSLAAPSGRLSLRARGDLSKLNGALGLALPKQIGAREAAGAVEVLCLGPDEWIIHAPEADVASIVAACGTVYDALPHSVVDTSGREVTFGIEGPRAAELLTLGAPRDIASIAVGEGRRTVFDGIAVVLWREDDNRFRMDVWHSFAPHVLGLLETGCRELAAETV
ncbi:MAG: sarcosine oxidase subunit gamma [Maritimibacter sp.]|nr:sarcosine oxidase subunit gamma [Maritimibacter sp.]